MQLRGYGASQVPCPFGRAIAGNNQFAQLAAGAALGSLASLLTAELGTALHLNGYGAQLFDAAVGSYAGSVLSR